MAFESANPARAIHRHIESLDVPLVLQAHRKTMQRTHSLIMLLIVAVELLGSLERHVEDNFKEILIL